MLAAQPNAIRQRTPHDECSNEQEYVRLQEEMGVDAVISDHLIVPRHKDASE